MQRWLRSKRPRTVDVDPGDPGYAARGSCPTRCTHCGRDAHDRDHELLQAALRARIRVLEARVWALEADLVARPVSA